MDTKEVLSAMAFVKATTRYNFVHATIDDAMELIADLQQQVDRLKTPTTTYPDKPVPKYPPANRFARLSNLIEKSNSQVSWQACHFLRKLTETDANMLAGTQGEGQNDLDIYKAFDWHWTPQGYDFWSLVCHGVDRMYTNRKDQC